VNGHSPTKALFLCKSLIVQGGSVAIELCTVTSGQLAEQRLSDCRGALFFLPSSLFLPNQFNENLVNPLQAMLIFITELKFT
jgi:hypothetical protein